MITVLGASGFIGSHLVKKLQKLHREYFCPNRDDDLSSLFLGNIIYCIGLTADFRSRPFDTVSAHVCKLNQILQSCTFDSLTYLSSTRLYKLPYTPACEDDDIQVNPYNFDDLYNISKVMGESILNASQKKIRVARLSNVYGPDFDSTNFLSEVVKEAIYTGKVTLRTSLQSAKDYVSIADVVDVLISIALHGKQQVYNVASGQNVSNLELMQKLKDLTGCQVEVISKAETIVFPTISIQRIQEEFCVMPSQVLTNIPALIETYRHFQEA